jgi:hypothetical protein
LIALKVRNNRYLDVSVLCIALSNSVLAVGIGSGYSHELFNRFFLYMLPAFVYFGIKLLHFRLTVTLLVLILIIGLPLSFISQYGNQAMDYITPGNVDAAKFFNKHSAHGVITGTGPLGSMQNAEGFKTESAIDLHIKDNNIDLSTSIWQAWSLFDIPHYINVDDHNLAQMDFYFNKPETLPNLEKTLEDTPHYNVIFNNPDMRLYINEIDILANKFDLN